MFHWDGNTHYLIGIENMWWRHTLFDPQTKEGWGHTLFNWDGLFVVGTHIFLWKDILTH